jgi:hypothetical protein
MRVNGAVPTRTKRICACLLVGGVTVAQPLFAAHPLQTEDTGTQGTGNVELENGFSQSNSGGSRVFMYQPQVSYGLTPSSDLIVQPSWTSAANSTHTDGFGDTNFDAKWRFFGEAPLSFGVRGGVTLATSQHELGLPHGSTSGHVLMISTYDAAPLTFHANIGVNRNPSETGDRKWQSRISAAGMWAANEHLTWVIDTGANTNPDPARGTWPAWFLAGAIYTLHPGLDLDAGLKCSTNDHPSTRVLLFGLTYRFAP